MSQTVFRYEVPIDDQWHTHNLTGAILHVASRKRDTVEFWALSTTGAPITRSFRVFGTGQEVPNTAKWRGTALSPADPARLLPAGQFAWHLFEAVA